MVAWPHRGAHGDAVAIVEEEDGDEAVRTASGGIEWLKRGTRHRQTWWQSEFGKGGTVQANLNLELLSAAVMVNREKEEVVNSGL